jgi:hypothetical protein
VVEVTAPSSGLAGQPSSSTPVSVSLLLSSTDALRVAAAPGEAVLVLLGAGSSDTRSGAAP